MSLTNVSELLPEGSQELNKESTTPVNKPKEKGYIFGSVRNCSVLNIRKGASPKSEIIGTFQRFDRVRIELDGSTERYYKVILSGIKDPSKAEGYCLKEYVEVKEG